MGRGTYAFGALSPPETPPVAVTRPAACRGRVVDGGCAAAVSIGDGLLESDSAATGVAMTPSGPTIALTAPQRQQSTLCVSLVVMMACWRPCTTATTNCRRSKVSDEVTDNF